MSMSSDTTRDRRAPLFGGGVATNSQPGTRGGVDVESLERENDAGIAALGERAGLLRNITAGIHGETASQLSVLDGLGAGVGGVRLGLRAAGAKFQRVVDAPGGRRSLAWGAGAAAALFVLYLWWR